MKKILTVFLSVLMVISLAACTKKAEEPKEEEPVIDEPKTSFRLEVDFANGVKESVEMSSDASDNFIECIKGLGPIIGEVTVENGKIVAVKDKKAENGAKWELYVNDGLYEDDVTKLTVSKDDVIRLVYVPGEEPQVNVELNEDVLGGWQTYEAFEDRMKEKEKKIFEKAMEGIDGVAYVPLRVLASQPVSGMNYAFLAQGITVTAVPSVDYYIVVIYVDTENNEDIKAINMLKVPEIETKEEGSDSLLGSWMIFRADEKEKISDKKIQTSFEKAIAQQKDLKVLPLQLLATQLVEGNNYMALCYGEPVEDASNGDLCIVEWYEDLKGNVSLTDIRYLNLAYYVAGE